MVDPTVNRSAISTFSSPTILKRPSEQPAQKLEVTFPSCFSSPRPLLLSLVSSASSSDTTRLNPRCRLQSSLSSRSRDHRVIHRFLPSTQQFLEHYLIETTLDSGVLLLEIGAPAERMNSIFDEGPALSMNSSNYMVSASFDLGHCPMCIFHDILYAGTGPSLIGTEVLTICCWQSPVTWAHLPRLCDANYKPLQLLIFVVLRLLLGRSQFRVPFIVNKTPGCVNDHCPRVPRSSHTCNCFYGRHRRKHSGTVPILGRNKATVNADESEISMSNNLLRT